MFPEEDSSKAEQLMALDWTAVWPSLGTLMLKSFKVKSPDENTIIEMTRQPGLGGQIVKS